MMLTDANLPDPPAFLDPLISIDTCHYYAVPKYNPFGHPNTRWLITMIKNNDEDRIRRKLEVSPELVRGKRFQLLDDPQLYLTTNAGSPAFKRKAILYLSALGLAIYLKNYSMTQLLLEHRDTTDAGVAEADEPQFASHIQDSIYGDFHAFPPCVLMMRRFAFECASPLLKNGWNHANAFAMPMRRKFERRAFFFHDWLDVALSLLAVKSLYPLQTLVLSMTQDMTVYKPLKMPLAMCLPTSPASKQQPSGFMDVEQLPLSARMMGTHTLLEMVEKYDQYLQMRQCARAIENLKREAIAEGINPEILAMQTDTYDPGYEFQEDNQSNVEININACEGFCVVDSQSEKPRLTRKLGGRKSRRAQRNANAFKKEKKVAVDADPLYASEACRILHFALERDKRGKSLQQCLDAVAILVRRRVFISHSKPSGDTPRNRDIKNVILLLLNLIQRDQNKVDVAVAAIKSGRKKFEHVEEHKMFENRKMASIQNIRKMVSLLTDILLSSKFIIFFLKCQHPVFSPKSVNVAPWPGTEKTLEEVKLMVITEFNSRKDAWACLTREMMKEVNKMASMQLHAKVGKKPSETAEKPIAKKKKTNNANVNSCLVTYRRVHRRKRQTTISAEISSSVCLVKAEAKGDSQPDRGNNGVDKKVDTMSVSAPSDDSQAVDGEDALPEIPEDSVRQTLEQTTARFRDLTMQTVEVQDAEQKTIDQLSCNKSTIDQLFCDKSTIDQLLSDKSTIDQVFGDQRTNEQLSRDHQATERLQSTCDQLTLELPGIEAWIVDPGDGGAESKVEQQKQSSCQHQQVQTDDELLASSASDGRRARDEATQTWRRRSTLPEAPSSGEWPSLKLSGRSRGLMKRIRRLWAAQKADAGQTELALSA